MMGHDITDSTLSQIDLHSVKTTIKSNMTIISKILPDKTLNVTQYTPDIEFNIYLKEESLDLNGDIFKYWEESKFKCLKMLAMKYHSCPAL